MILFKPIPCSPKNQWLLLPYHTRFTRPAPKRLQARVQRSPPPPLRFKKQKKVIIPVIEIFFLCIEHRCAQLSLNIYILHDYFLKFPNSPFSNIISKSVFLGQNVRKIVINYAVSVKKIETSCHHSSLTFYETPYIPQNYTKM